jgi:protein-S-isoprenylcysteine O-methyltransferase Ste14
MNPQSAEYVVWAGWGASWLAASLWASPAADRPSLRTQFPNLAITAAGFALLFSVRPTQTSGLLLWRAPQSLAWSAVAFSVLGCAFCWWARVHLGALWSGTVTAKRDHHVVDSGPYGLVRHPIYIGILAAAVGQAVLAGSLNGLAGLALLTLGFVLKARIEERFLKSALGAAVYDAYAAHTPMLLPSPWRRRGAHAQDGER